jgi:glutamate/tyrosine decarboxylase-like PLP-dependent enzyme
VEPELVRRTAELATRWLESLPARRVRADMGRDELLAALGGPLPERGEEPLAVIEALAACEPGLIATAGPRYYGFVIGGSLPAATAADMLTVAWDQVAAAYASSPTGSAVEEVASAWLVDLLGLPPGTSTGFVTGGQGANTTALAAARQHVLARAGWDVGADGLRDAPPVRVLAGEAMHISIRSAARLLGLGERRIEVVAMDEQGRMRPDALSDALAAGEGPVIVCAQAGEVNTGAFDPLEDVVAAAREHRAWVHVDGAIGLWAAASERFAPLVRGLAGADSWATDAHKGLNVPYDSGLVFTAHPESHRTAMSVAAAYLPEHSGGERWPSDWVPEMSRRARGFAVYAALRSLGRAGVAELFERLCDRARQMAALLDAGEDVELLNEVVLNQVLVRFGDDDEVTRRTIAAVQEDGTCWLGGTTWRGQGAMRISVSNWRTSEDDVERSAAAILAAHRAVAGRAGVSG